MTKDKTIPPYMDYDIKQEIPICWVQENEDLYKIMIAEDFELKENNGEWFAVRKKPQYPKTFQECCELLRCDKCIVLGTMPMAYNYLIAFQKLLIYRDAYWKIAGEEIGLGKPWEPDWNNDEWPDMSYISYDGKSIDKENGFPCCNMILIFPTEEMRDAFYENFKDLIYECKELL